MKHIDWKIWSNCRGVRVLRMQVQCAACTVLLSVLSTCSGCVPSEPPPPSPVASTSHPRSNHSSFWVPGEAANALPKYLDYVRTRAQSINKDSPLLFVVLIDETGMDEDKRKVMSWSDVRSSIKQVIDSMDSHDQIEVLAVTNDSNQASSVRLQLMEAPEETVLVPGWKKNQELVVDGLADPGPPRAQGSDILGGLKAARVTCDQKTRIPVVIGLSDMVPQDTNGKVLMPDDPSKQSDQAEEIGQFPDNCMAGFFYVKTKQYQKIVDYWHTVLDKCNLNTETP